MNAANHQPTIGRRTKSTIARCERSARTLLACVFVVLSTVMIPANDEPFLATVTGPNACLRSGPGDDYYVTNPLAAGQMLEVYYVIGDQWCAVRPPAGSFSWVDARNVRIDKKQVGEVLINGVSARVGSEVGNMCGAVQVVLDRGEKVYVFERVETPNDIDTPVWYRIAPPAGEFRFIRTSELQFDHAGIANAYADRQYNADDATEQPRTLRTQSPIMLVSGSMPQQNATSNRQGSQLSSNVVPPGSLPIPGMSRSGTTQNTQQNHVDDNAVRVAANTRPSTSFANTQSNTQPNQSTSVAPPRVTRNAAQPAGNAGGDIDSDDFREILGQLKVDLADALLGQETANDTMQSLGHQARMLYQAADSPNDRAEVYQMIAGIERATRVRRHEEGQNRSGENASSNGRRDERYDGRMMQASNANRASITTSDTTSNRSSEPEMSEQVSPPTPPLSQPSRNAGTGTRTAGTSQRLALPRIEAPLTTTINTTPEPNDTAQIQRYSAQESFFDSSGRYAAGHAGMNGDAQYGQYPSQDIEIYLDSQGRYTDASGQVIDGQTLGAILHGADVVLMYDPHTGGYREMSQGGGYGGTTGQQNAGPQKSWLQRLVSGELFQSGDKSSNASQNMQPGYANNMPVMTGSGYAPHTYQMAYGDGFGGDAFAFPQMQGMPQQNTAMQQPSKRGFFATSQPSIVPQQNNALATQGYQNRGNPYAAQGYAMPNGGMTQGNMMPGNFVPNNGTQGWPGMQQGVMREITLPEGVEMPGEVVVYDESQGVNLLGNMQNATTSDQLALLIQQMGTQTGSPTSATQVMPRANLPLTEAESRMLTRANGNGGTTPVARTVQLRSSQQDASPNRGGNHQVTGHMENGVGRVSADAFDAMGKLGRITNADSEMPKYALVDESGKPICLVSPAAGVELKAYLNQTVGITGVKSNYVREGETFRHVSAKAVYPITR